MQNGNGSSGLDDAVHVSEMCAIKGDVEPVRQHSTKELDVFAQRLLQLVLRALFGRRWLRKRSGKDGILLVHAVRQVALNTPSPAFDGVRKSFGRPPTGHDVSVQGVLRPQTQITLAAGAPDDEVPHVEVSSRTVSMTIERRHL